MNILEYIIIVIPGLIALAAALIKVRNVSFTKFLLLALEFAINPKKRFWDHRAIAAVVDPDLTDKNKSQKTRQDLEKKSKNVNLRELSATLDSGGTSNPEDIKYEDLDKVNDDDLITQAYFGHRRNEGPVHNMYWRTRDVQKKKLGILAKLPSVKVAAERKVEEKVEVKEIEDPYPIPPLDLSVRQKSEDIKPLIQKTEAVLEIKEPEEIKPLPPEVIPEASVPEIEPEAMPPTHTVSITSMSLDKKEPLSPQKEKKPENKTIPASPVTPSEPKPSPEREKTEESPSKKRKRRRRKRQAESGERAVSRLAPQRTNSERIIPSSPPPHPQDSPQPSKILEEKPKPFTKPVEINNKPKPQEIKPEIKQKTDSKVVPKKNLPLTANRLPLSKDLQEGEEIEFNLD